MTSRSHPSPPSRPACGARLSRAVTLAPLALVGSYLLVACLPVPSNPPSTTTTTAPASTTTAAPTSTVPATTSTTAAPTTTTTAGHGSSVSTATAVQAGHWGSNVTITLGNGTFTFQSNGIPNHSRPDSYLVPKQGIAVPTSASDFMVLKDPTGAQNYNYTITTNPTYSATTTKTGLGLIGVMISGAAMANPYEADQKTVALDNNFTVNGYSFIDSCNGHPNGMRMYHYHGVPFCVTSTVDTPGQHSTMIGVALDGFPIYGPQDDGGVAPTSLDECNGEFGPTPEFPQGIYHYHLTTTAPYTMNCYHGVVSSSTTSAMPQHAH